MPKSATMGDRKQRPSPDDEEVAEENAPADLRNDHLPAEPTLHYSGALKTAKTSNRLYSSSPSPTHAPPPAEALSRSEYLRIQRKSSSAGKQAPGKPEATWTGGTMPAIAYRTDYLTGTEDAEMLRPSRRSGPTRTSADSITYWENDDAYPSSPGELEGLDDRPLWMAELDLTEDDIEDDIYEAERAARQPSAERLEVKRQGAQDMPPLAWNLRLIFCLPDSTALPVTFPFGRLKPRLRSW